MARRPWSLGCVLFLVVSLSAFAADTTAPVLSIPRSSVTVEAAGPLTVVNFLNAANDAVDGPVPITCTPPSGSAFPLGATLVTCSASDLSGNVATGSFTVNVRDTRPPVFAPFPPSLTTGATSPSGAALTFVLSATDVVDGAVPVVCSPASGSFFPVGTTNVACTATDARGNLARKSFSVTIIDTFPPVISAAGVPQLSATGPDGAEVTYDVTAVDAVDGAVDVQCTPPSGSVFAVGTTIVTCTAVDARGNDAVIHFPVTVSDLPPVIISVTPSQATLWPPNHKMVAVTVDVQASDDVDPAPTARIVSIRSSEPDDAHGDGHTSGDFEVTGPLTANLRAERAGGGVRTYTITIEVRDFSGHVVEGECVVRVEH